MRAAKVALASALLMATCGIGCSVPDDSNYDTLRRNVAALPPSVIVDAKRWAANRAAARVISGQSDNYVFRILCREDGQEEWTEFTSVFPWSVLACLEEPEAPLYLECLDRLFRRDVELFQQSAAGGKCKRDFHWQYGHGEKPIVLPEFEAEEQDEDDVANRLIEADKLPAWLPLIVVGGVVIAVVAPEFLPALCSLSEGGPACPSSPDYPPGQTPQPAQPGSNQ